MNIGRCSLWLLVLLVSLTSFTAAADDEDAVVGRWLSPKKKNQIDIYRRGDRYYGKLVWMQEPYDPATQKPKTDRNNPDERLRQRPILNLDIMSSFRYGGDKVWTNGQIYNPEDGKTYSCELTLKNPNTLEVRGYMLGMSFLGKTSVWTRVK
ncbi:DUF2147 domain-containing protein [Nibrella viscosa]|uniref:DUF2147 domain-containing protein n=1 Tax=Nibrella viscosa TaxID=1084524 RepID=A0ABP8KWR6_9BACT